MIELHHADCLHHMRTMPEGSVDAIVSDPPYGLSFMGKDWDHGVPGVHFWEEALRVAKPGTHLLAFGGTRTFHRLAVAIEDAGWEIRDTLMFIYGSGFPKSRNLKNVFCTCDETSEQTAEHHVRPVREADLSKAVAEGRQQGQVLFEVVPEQGSSPNGTERSESEATGSKQPSMEGRGNGVQEKGQLFERPICSGSPLGEADGAEGWVCNGTPAGNGEGVRAAIEPNGSGTPSQPQSNGERQDQLGAVAGQQQPQARGVGAVCSRCSKPVPPFDVSGYGTALKPAFEPIIMARKPLAGTVAKNVQEHGTGAINVDGCRVCVSEADAKHWATSTRGTGGVVSNVPEPKVYREPLNSSASLGRWPANVIHDGSEEVVGMFPTSSVTGARTERSKDAPVHGTAWLVNNHQSTEYTDTGSAARFFYCAKASKQDRDEGTTHVNTHPTVKPTALMRYLCKLITPPNGIVFDPFMGSGSTGKAAALEGFSFIGCDLQKEYVDIARARIEHAQKKRETELGLFANAPAA